jgi:Flp pilus assembly protein TadG
MKKLLRQYVRLLKGRDKGTVAVTFLLSLPLLLFTLCVIAQYALIINARLVLDRATSAAGRSAMVCLPTDPQIDMQSDNVTPVEGEGMVSQAAMMVLESISPKAQGEISEEARTITLSLQDAGIAVPDSYADHYTFAQAATTVEWARVDSGGQPIGETQWTTTQFAQSRGQAIQVTVHYRFYLNVPGVKLWGRALSGQAGPETVAGVTGYFIPLTSSYIVQLSHGREAQALTDGSPLQAPVE